MSDKAKDFFASTLAQHLRNLQAVAKTTDEQREVGRKRMHELIRPHTDEIFRGMTGSDVLLMHLEQFIELANFIEEPESPIRWHMADLTVQQVRTWLESQPFSLRVLTLILFMLEAIESKYGKGTATNFENELREAFNKARINLATN